LLEFNGSELHPGTNRIRIDFVIYNFTNINQCLFATSPITNFVSPDICHINTNAPPRGDKAVVLRADLSVSNADYSIKLWQQFDGYMKTIVGSTTNGVINETWNRNDDVGNVYESGVVTATYHVVVSNSVAETVRHDYSF
jgi:hypothetical protein